MTAMNYYIIDAQAPLVFRSGKPFGAQAGASDAELSAAVQFSRADAPPVYAPSQYRLNRSR